MRCFERLRRLGRSEPLLREGDFGGCTSSEYVFVVQASRYPWRSVHVDANAAQVSSELKVTIGHVENRQQQGRLLDVMKITYS